MMQYRRVGRRLDGCHAYECRQPRVKRANPISIALQVLSKHVITLGAGHRGRIIKVGIVVTATGDPDA